MPRPRTLLALGAAVTAALVLGGCTAPGEPAPGDSGGPRIVASTDVYGSVARAVAGDRADIVSLVEGSSRDPHSFEASARDQLVLNRAEVVIENGGGYDDFVDTLLASAATSENRVVLDASQLSGLDVAANEHVWYDFGAMRALADALATTLGEVDPGNAAEYTANAASFADELSALNDRAAQLRSSSGGGGVAITEPVPLYLLQAVGLINRTPEAFSEAVEEGTDVPPTVLRDTLAVLTDGSVRLLAYNEQTAGPETEEIRAAAEAAGVPVVPFTETLPAGADYVSWMTANLDALQSALS